MIDYTENSGKQYHIGIGKEDIGQYVSCREIRADAR